MDLSDKRILVVKPSSLGDVVHTLPVVHSIKRRWPGCHIAWIVQENLGGLLEHDPAVDEIIPIFIPSTSDPSGPRGVFFKAAAATLGTVTELRKRFAASPYDVVLDLHASFRSGLLGMTNPGGFRMGFADAKELNTFFQHHRVRTHPEKPHAVDKNLEFCRYLGCEPVPEDFRVVTGVEQKQSVVTFLAAAGAGPGEPLVYANPATRWESKFWTTAGWARLADMLLDAGVKVIFGGAPADLEHIHGITSVMKLKPLVAAGKMSLAESAALLEVADVYVGVDSGPMHIAAFTDTSVVAIFGPTDPAKVGPYGSGHRVVRAEGLNCLGCRKRSCPEMTCMERIDPLMVFEATMLSLDERHGGNAAGPASGHRPQGCGIP